MNLNYDMASFVDPKIQIAPRELPVEEMMKVGNVLQDRFDKAMENETKTSFALKKLEESANPLDRETARTIRENTQKRLTDRATNGRYQDMQWQTQQDALEAASNYEALANRNKNIQAEISAIMKNDAWKDKDARIKDFMRTVKSSNYDTENRMLTGLDVNPFGAAKDVNGEHLALEYGKNAKPFVYNGASGKLVRLDINGKTIPENDRTTKQAYLGHQTSTGDLKILKEEDLTKTLRANLLGDADMQAMMDRDLKHLYAENGIDPNNPNQAEAAANIKNQWIQKEIDKPAAAMGHLLRQYEDTRKTDVTASQEYKGAGNAWGYGEQQDVGNTYTKADVFKGEKEAGKLEFPQEATKAMEGDNTSKVKILSALDYMTQNGDKEAGKAKEVFNDLLKLQEEYPEYAEVIRNRTVNKGNNPLTFFAQAVTNVGRHVAGMMNTGIKRADEFNQKGKQLMEKYDNLVNQGFFDSKFENAFEETTSGSPLTRKMPIVTTSLGNEEARKLISSWDGNLSIGDFNIVKGDGKDFKDNGFKVTGWTKEPYGGGTGILLELSDGNKTILAAPNKTEAGVDIVSQLNNVLPGMTNNNLYKDVTPLHYAGQKKTIKDFQNEAGLPATPHDDSTIELTKDGQYIRKNSSGQITGKSESMYELLPKYVK